MKNKQFYPSNGTEGEGFISIHCENCYKYNQCTILINSFFGKRPKQWIFNDENKPICTSFNPNRPGKSKVKPSPNQLTLL